MLVAIIGGPHVGKSTVADHLEAKNIEVTTKQEDIEKVDLIALVVDASQIIDEADVNIAESIKNIDIPKLLVLNKVDLTKEEDLNAQLEVASHLGNFDGVLPISSQTGQGIDKLVNKLIELSRHRNANETP